MVDSIKITALQDIGANIAYTTLVPVVNMAGTPTTQKANLQNLGNLILNGAGGSYFARAAQANLALSVANAAQPNITSVGTLTSLVVTGNIRAGNANLGNIATANFYYGDGGFLTNVASGSNYSNSNVAAYLPTYTGNVGAGNVNATGTVYASGISSTGLASLTILNVSTTANLGAVGNVKITGGTSGQKLTTDGTGNLSWTNDANSSYGDSNVTSLLSAFGSNTITTTGNVSVGNIIGNGQALTNIAGANVSGFVPNANVANTAYAVAAANVSGLGNIATINLTGSTSNVLFGNGTFAVVPAPTVSQDITSNGAMSIMLYDGNIKYNNYATVEPSSGNIAGNNISASGNITANNLGNISNINLTGSNANVLYGNGVFAAVAGGANTGNVTFDDVTIQGVNGLNLSAGADFTANLAYLQVRAGDVASHIHLDTGNNSAYDLIVGDDQNYVQVSSTGNILLSSYDSNTAQYTWTLDYNGNLILAGGNSVIQSIANSSLDPINPNVSTMVLTPDANYNSQVLVLDPTAPGHIHLRAYAFSNIDVPSANIFLGGEDTSFEITSGSNNQAVIHSGGNDWVFDNTGNLIVPGASGGVIKTVANGAIAIAAIDGGSNNPAQVISFNANGTPTTALSAYASEATIQANINGSIQTWAFTNAGVVTSPVLTYANLSAATTAGRRAFISDANLAAAGNFGNAVSGGGANTVPVYSDGSVWRIG